MTPPLNLDQAPGEAPEKSTQERLQEARARATAETGPTSYMVLRQTGHEDWTPVGEFEARSAPDAIRQAVQKRHAGDEDADGTYVAVSPRSWKPVKVETETRTTLDIKGL